ncbi:leukocyte surface antigen CD53-like isoform X2 [Limulus polyphemus]|uniref:Leukocyte surface antigen CD53-like isoform X2 n=1 Tax=Limulus polyphemus TaxID=6850 RepID=A0ABM1SGC5_LIMPO|nr:leukocyte surface antigen CD53-like isoform X2 [Limulus polyphemus]
MVSLLGITMKSVIHNIKKVFALVQFGTGLAIREEQLELKSSERLTVNHITIGAIIAVAAGPFSFLLCIWGIYVMKHKKLFLSYTLLLIPVVAEITLCVFVWKYSTGEMVRIFTTEAMLQEIQRYYTSTSATQAIDSIQTKFMCCGPVSTEDYIQKNLSVPYSCIANTRGGYYEKGCGAELSGYLTDKSNLLGWIGTLLIVFQVTALGIAFNVFEELAKAEEEKTTKDYQEYMEMLERQIAEI